MGIIVGLIPALIWGFLPIILKRFVKGGPYIQALGTGTGIAAVSVIATLILQPAVPDPSGWILCFLSGTTWIAGTFGQMVGFQRIGVSRTFPLSAGLQIVGNALLGWLILGEWHGAAQVGAGLFCTAVVFAGVLISNGSGRDSRHSGDSAADSRHLDDSAADSHHSRDSGADNRSSGDSTADIAAYVIVAVTSFGYCIYSLLPKISGVTDSSSQSLPQSLGILAGAIVIAIALGRKDLSAIDKNVRFPWYRTASITGLLYGLASLVYLFSVQLNGMINGFLLSQINMVIATISGIVILKEPLKTSAWKVALGIVMILGGCIAIQFV